ncbi:hypothetical protein [Dietzia sp. B32]|uniref:hypothetical protein n=1 Tax=Dietzia sp. B32 TaxID=2915130 RepID=UPI0021AD861E|nr:hypothetical protein [Dietzia sp. B32]UVE94654.1 hypothetical protein L8M95_14160 [Dietzia sp. B32]
MRSRARSGRIGVDPASGSLTARGGTTTEEIEIDGDTATVTVVNTLTARADVKDFMGMSLDEGQTMTLTLRGRYTVDDDRIREIHIKLL